MQIITQIQNKIKSKFASDYIYNSISMVIAGLGGLLINILIVTFLGSNTLGVFNTIYAIFLISSQLSVGGLQFSVLKHCSWNQNNMDECYIQTLSGIILTFFLSFIFAVILFSLSGFIGLILKSHDITFGVKLIAIGVIFYSLNKVIFMTFNGIMHMRALAVFNALRFVIYPVFIILFILIKIDNRFLPLALSLGEVILFIFILIYLQRIFSFRLNFNGRFTSLVKEHFSYGLRGYFSGILIEANTRIDILMLGYYCPYSLVGIYSFSAVFAEGFAQFITVMRRNIDPLLGRYFAENQLENIMTLSKKIRKYFYPFMIISGLLLSAIFPIMLTLMKVQQIAQYCYVFLILVTGYVIISGYNCFIGLLLQANRPGIFTMMIFITVIINIILNLILIPLLGIYGAAFATFLAFIGQTLFIIISSKMLFNIHL